MKMWNPYHYQQAHTLLKDEIVILDGRYNENNNLKIVFDQKKKSQNCNW